MARVIYVDLLPGTDRRLYGMMQHLMAAYADQHAPENPDPRGVVELQDASDERQFKQPIVILSGDLACDVR